MPRQENLHGSKEHLPASARLIPLELPAADSREAEKHRDKSKNMDKSVELFALSEDSEVLNARIEAAIRAHVVGCEAAAVAAGVVSTTDLRTEITTLQNSVQMHKEMYAGLDTKYEESLTEIHHLKQVNANLSSCGTKFQKESQSMHRELK